MTKQEFIKFIYDNAFDMIDLDLESSRFREVPNLEQKLKQWVKLDKKIQRQFKNNDVCLVGVGTGKENLYFEYSNCYGPEDRPLIELKLWI